MESPDAFGAWFGASSWLAWRVVLKAAFALPLSPDEMNLFGELAGDRMPPRTRVRELWCVCGRRSGKDSIASLIAAYAAAIEEAHVGRLRPGEAATIACLASDRDQARIVLGYTRALFEQNEELAGRMRDPTKFGFRLDNASEIVVATNSFRATRGRTILIAILDECAFYRDENSSSPDWETYRALEPSLATLAPQSMLVGISSPHKRAGLLYDKFSRHFGKSDDGVLVIKAPSLRMNPTLDPSIVERALEEDPEAARAEWLAEWRSDLADFISRELVQAAIESGIIARPPQNGVRYIGFADTAGGTGRDSFTAAVAHTDGNLTVLDALLEMIPPFSPSTAVEQSAQLFKSYRVHTITGDAYAAGFVVDAFREAGITYRRTERDRSTIYREVLPLFTTGRARLLDNKRLVNQFASLERRVTSTGRDIIDHPRGDFHDDLSNAVSGALVEASRGRQPMIIDNALLERAAHPFTWTGQHRIQTYP